MIALTISRSIASQTSGKMLKLISCRTYTKSLNQSLSMPPRSFPAPRPWSLMMHAGVNSVVSYAFVRTRNVNTCLKRVLDARQKRRRAGHYWLARAAEWFALHRLLESRRHYRNGVSVVCWDWDRRDRALASSISSVVWHRNLIASVVHVGLSCCNTSYCITA